MLEPEKPFACTLPDCGMTFTNEDHLHVHTKKHDMVLQLGLEQKTAFVADQTPTPTRFIRNCEEVGLFQDLQNVNPFDEGFKRAMETKHGILSLENAIAASESDDVLHTPQFPLIDPGDTTLFSTTNNERNITISRSSSDESGTIKEYETTTISKSTNEVTTISRFVGNRDVEKLSNADIKNTGAVNQTKDSVVNETVSYKNNVIKIHSNIEIRKEEAKAPVLIYTDSVVKDTSVITKDVLLTDSNKLQVPDKLPPIMSQKSLDLVVDSLTNDITSEVGVKTNNNDADVKTPVATTDEDKIANKNALVIQKGKVTKKCIKKPKVTIKDENNYEVIIKLPNGKQVKMKTVDDKPIPDPKEVIRQRIAEKVKPQNLITVPLEKPVQNIIQIPQGTLIPVTLVAPSIIPNKIPIPQLGSSATSIINVPVTPLVDNVKTILNIASKSDRCPEPLTNIKITPPYRIRGNNSKKKATEEVICITEDEIQNVVKERETKKETVKQNTSKETIKEIEKEGYVKKSRHELDCRSAAAKRYRDRNKEAMRRQAEENRQLREANQRLVAEKAVLKLLITEHMKCCPNAENLRLIQERINQNGSNV